jgi:hypothetical protein
MRLSSLIALALVVLGAACAGPEAAPKDLNGLARFFFNKFKPAEGEDPSTSDIELQDAIAKTHTVVKGDELSSDEPMQGTLENLTQEEVDTAGLELKASKGQGMFIANIIHCDLQELKDIVLTPDQLDLYPEAYAEYERDFDADVPDYLPTWTVTYTSAENALITNQFTANVKTGLRTVPATEDAEFGTALVRAGFVPEPATFENPSDEVEFSFDFQVETYHERKKGEVVHFYGMWRYMKLGVLGDSYDQVFIEQTLGGMIDWDKKTDELCK